MADPATKVFNIRGFEIKAYIDNAHAIMGAECTTEMALNPHIVKIFLDGKTFGSESEFKATIENAIAEFKK